jgi:putative membrane protein
MKVYNAKNFLKILFSLNKSDTLIVLFPSMLLVAIYSFGIYYLELEYLHLTENSGVSNVSLLHSLLGFVLSLLLVFQTNTAYDRWWEGRKLWGKLVNDSRNLSIKLSNLLPRETHEKERNQLEKYLKFYPHILAKHLSKESTRLALDEDYADLETSLKHHSPAELVHLINRRIIRLNQEGLLSDFDILSLLTDKPKKKATKHFQP